MRRMPYVAGLFCENLLVFAVLFFVGGADLLAIETGPAEGKTPFGVGDAIEMTYLNDPNALLAEYIPPKVKISPDGAYFVIVTRKGNLKTGQNDYNLLLYNTAEVLEYVNYNAEPALMHPEGGILARFSSSDPVVGHAPEVLARAFNDAIKAVTWLPDSRTIAFLGQEEGQPRQVFTVDVISGRLRKYTSHPRSVEAFKFDASRKKLLFLSTVANYHSGRGKTAFVVGTRNIGEIMDVARESNYPHYQFYALNIGGEEISTPREPAKAIGEKFPGILPPPIWLSPDGWRAISQISVEDAPRQWGKDYIPFAAKGSYHRQALKSYDPNIMAKPANLFRQFVLVDVEKQAITPLFDGPSGLISAGIPAEALWRKDGEHVILANVFLPLSISDKTERARRRKTPAVVEYNVRTGRISWIVGLLDNDKERFTNISLTADGNVLLKRRNPDGQALPVKVYQKNGDSWELAGEEKTRNEEEQIEAKNRIDLSLYQALNTPPEIRAKDQRTGQSKIITDLNPQFRNRTFGRTEIFRWTDAEGRNWQGGLVYPPTYMKGERHPLIIQTHGFNPEAFLIDGPGSGYAAQAFANKEMMVLQLPDYPGVGGTRAELMVHRAGIEAAIDRLDQKGLIDRRKVGLMGFSATGVIVAEMLAFSPYDFAAATIASAYSTSVSGYIWAFGTPAPGIFQIEQMLGAAPWGKSRDLWVRRNPLMNLERVKTPLRLEQYGNEVFPWWDVYVFLRWQGKPVEFLIFPKAAHFLMKPENRLVSQQGNVDWFSFWLKGEEDPDPAKAEQYRRWRVLRNMPGKTGDGKGIENEKIEN